MVVIMVLTAVPLSGFVGLELPILNWGIKASALAESGQCGENVYWNYDSTTGELVISGTGPMWDYEYHEDWTGWSTSPFYNSDIRSVIINDGVTSIGDYAFYCCDDLKYFDIGDNVVSLDSILFDEWYFGLPKNIETLIIGSGIKEIPSRYFYGSALKRVIISEGVERINDEAFANCINLETINFPDSLKYMGKDILKNTAWFNYKGKGLIIQDHWVYGFKGTETGIVVDLPEDIKGVAYQAFNRDRNIVAFEVDVANPYLSSKDGVLFNKDKTVLIACPAGKAFTSYVIPDTVEEILGEAFANGNYNYLTMGKSVKKIGYDAFSGAGVINVYVDNLESWCNIEFENGSANPLIENGRLYVDGNLVSSLVIPDTITEIKPYAFCYCDSIDDVTIPDSVITIGESAFQYCSSLVSVSFGKGLKTIEAFAFYSCRNIKDVFYPGSQEEWEKIIIDSNKGGDGYIRNANLFLMHSHEYTETVVKQVSCTSDGEILYTCIHGDTITEILYASGHNWVDMGGSVKATCTTNGVDNYKCSNCGEEKKGTTPAMDHNWEYLELTYETCDKDGYMLRACQREGCNAKEEKVTPATHDLEEWNVKSPTCTESGEKSVSCMDCTYSSVVVIPAKGHTYSEWVELLPATCSERGLNIKICKDCNDIQRQIIPKLAHIDADGNGVCDSCENTDTPDVPDTPNEPDVPEDTSANCSCRCHKGGLSSLLFKLVLLFQRFLRLNQTCACGASHY